MKLPLLGPAEVVALLGSVRENVGSALDLVPRLALLVGRVEELLGRVEMLVSSIERTTARADLVVSGTEATRRRADEAVTGAQGAADRIDALLAAFEPSLSALAPVVARLAQTTSTDEVDAGISLVDRLPRLATHLEDDILPLLATLNRVGPDVHELLEVTQDLRQVITGLPGVGFLRRHGDDELPDRE